MDTGSIITLLCLFVLLPIYLIVQDDKSGKKKSEKYGDAVGKYASSISDAISSFAKDVTESSETKRKHSFQMTLLSHIEYLTNNPWITPNDEYNSDPNIIKALEFFGVDIVEYKKALLHAWAIGEIKECSSWGFGKNKEVCSNNPAMNEHALKNDTGKLKTALDVFKIANQDWIKYGFTTLQMYEADKLINSIVKRIDI